MKINNLISRLKTNVFWKSVAVLVSGTALAQSIGVFSTPIVSRLYSPSAFGEFAIILSTSGIITGIVSLGLNSAIMVPKHEDESKEVFTVTFYTILFLSTVVLIILIITSPFIQFFNSGMNYILAVILVYSFVVINSLVGILGIFVNRKKLNRVLFNNSLIGALATLCITIPLGVLNLGSLGLIVASLLAGIISLIQMLYHVNPFIKIPSISNFKNIYRKYKEFILYQYPSNFIVNLATQLPTQVFSPMFGNANLGSYSINEKILGIPSRLIGTPINIIYFRTASEYYKEGKNLADFTFSLIVKIMLLSLFPILVTIIWGEQIFSLVLGSNWGEAGKLAGFLIVQYVFMFCAKSTSYLRVVIGKQKVNLVLSFLNLAITAISIFLGIYLFGDLVSTVICFTIGSSLYLILDMSINFYCLEKYWFKYSLFAIVYISAIVVLWILSGRFNVSVL